MTPGEGQFDFTWSHSLVRIIPRVFWRALIALIALVAVRAMAARVECCGVRRLLAKTLLVGRGARIRTMPWGVHPGSGGSGGRGPSCTVQARQRESHTSVAAVPWLGPVVNVDLAGYVFGGVSADREPVADAVTTSFQAHAITVEFHDRPLLAGPASARTAVCATSRVRRAR